MRYNAIIIDIDNTLLDQTASLEATLEATFDFFQYEIDSTVVATFLSIYEQVERLNVQGRITNEQIIDSALDNFLQVLDGNDIDAQDFKDTFVAFYCQNAVPHDGARRVLKKLSRFFPIFCATNSNRDMQELRLQYSGLLPYVQDIFSPAIVGCEKPNLRFFKECCNIIGLPPADILYIGDSLTEDIHPALSFGMATAWYNPNNANTKRKQPTFIISNLHKLMMLLASWSFEQKPSSNNNRY